MKMRMRYTELIYFSVPSCATVDNRRLHSQGSCGLQDSSQDKAVVDRAFEVLLHPRYRYLPTLQARNSPQSPLTTFHFTVALAISDGSLGGAISLSCDHQAGPCQDHGSADDW